MEKTDEQLVAQALRVCEALPCPGPEKHSDTKLSIKVLPNGSSTRLDIQGCCGSFEAACLDAIMRDTIGLPKADPKS